MTPMLQKFVNELYQHSRLLRFYARLKNQFRIHGSWAPAHFIIKMAWQQSKWKYGEKVFKDIEVVNIKDL